MHDPIYDVIDATWPAASITEAGGFRIREGRGGGNRVSAASLTLPLAQADLSVAERAQRDLGQVPLFLIREGEAALDRALADRGYALVDPVVIYAAPVQRLAAETPRASTFAIWPPLRIIRDLWADSGIDPARQAVIDRTAAPCTAMLSRVGDRCAGTAHVAVHGKTAMLHALVTLEHLRRQGAARRLIAEAASWAARHGAEDFALLVTRSNAPANALYESLGMTIRTAFHYRRHPGAAA